MAKTASLLAHPVHMQNTQPMVGNADNAFSSKGHFQSALTAGIVLATGCFNYCSPMGSKLTCSENLILHLSLFMSVGLISRL